MPLSVQEKFDKAVAYVKNLPEDGPYQPDQDTKLNYYANFKQATEGDVNVAKPGVFSLVARAKWNAWDAVKGRSKEDAQKEYVKLLVQV
ncbi:acyl-CoA-binding protein [Paxillus ammoniavirescens]|nr:acyl-CoA-binding protein [Paxillus ammoniavirescens]